MTYNPQQPSFHILICLIQIWKLDDPQNLSGEPQNPILITEAQRIEIEDSYKKLIGTASVSFPRGTVIKKTSTELNLVGDNISTQSVVIANMDNGVLMTTRTNSRAATTADFSVGSRIKIMLGYTTDPHVASLTKPNQDGQSIYNNASLLAEYKGHLTTMFDGFITKCSINTPIEIKCEDLASNLKKVSCPKIVSTNNVTVNDLLSENGKYKLLKNTGLKLHPDTQSMDINIGKIALSPDLTIADILTGWNKIKLYAYIKYNNEEPCIAVGRTYFSKIDKDNILNGSNEISVIDFSYHVAENGLSMASTDKAFLAVTATSMEKDGKFYQITVRMNPDYNKEDENSSRWQVLNETKISKKARKAGATVLGKSSDRVDLSTYTIIPYMSQKIGISHDDLLDEAIKYFESYQMNGVEGSLTLFGDLALRSGTKVELKDERYPQKNGYYLVDEVNTKFGVDGYRQTIKLPYMISKKKVENES